MFTLILKNGDRVMNGWGEISDKVLVRYMDSNKVVYLCNLDASSMTASLGSMTTTMEVPSDCKVYYAMKGQTSFVQGSGRVETLSGIIIGLVKNGEIVEERFLNNFTQEISGFKK